jgi:hypothetical protein
MWQIGAFNPHAVHVLAAKETAMNIRLIIIVAFLGACSGSGNDIAKTIDLSAARLAEIKSKPYTPGNGPGGFSAARLSGSAIDTAPDGILFLGYGPYLHEMGFSRGMMITAIDGLGVNGIFAHRWQGLRLQNPAAFDAAHYKDMVEYIFRKEPGDHVLISIDTNASAIKMDSSNHQSAVEHWRINFEL